MFLQLRNTRVVGECYDWRSASWFATYKQTVIIYNMESFAPYGIKGNLVPTWKGNFCPIRELREMFHSRWNQWKSSVPVRIKCNLFCLTWKLRKCSIPDEINGNLLSQSESNVIFSVSYGNYGNVLFQMESTGIISHMESKRNFCPIYSYNVCHHFGI